MDGELYAQAMALCCHAKIVSMNSDVTARERAELSRLADEVKERLILAAARHGS